MSPLDLLWHLLNFVAPAAVVGMLAPAVAKLIWRRRWRSLRWATLAPPCCAAGLLALVVGWVLFGRDGRMATYLLMVVAVAAALGWFGRRVLGPGGRA